MDFDDGDNFRRKQHEITVMAAAFVRKYLDAGNVATFPGSITHCELKLFQFPYLSYIHISPQLTELFEEHWLLISNVLTMTLKGGRFFFFYLSSFYLCVYPWRPEEGTRYPRV